MHVNWAGIRKETIEEIRVEEKIRWPRVFLGGFVSGFVLLLFLVLFGWQYSHVFLVLPPELANLLCAAAIILAFLLAITMAWLYATVRLQLKPGMWTAVRIGAGLGILFAVILYLGWRMTLGSAPIGIWLFNTAPALVGLPVASILNAWIYEKPA